MPGGIRLQTMQHKKPTNEDETWHSIFPVENEELVYGGWLRIPVRAKLGRSVIETVFTSFANGLA
jgi:hypothetical protein